MKIQVGAVKMGEIKEQRILIESKDTDEVQVVNNSKTRNYLLPCLKEYGKVFTNKLSKVMKIAAGIGDVILSNRDISYEKHIFILLDSAKPMHEHFDSFMNFIKQQVYFVDDYVYGDIQKSTFHMVVLQFPEKYYTALDKFKAGQYSEMYTIEDIEKFFENHPTTKAILIKEHGYRVEFTKKLNRRFGTTIQPEEYEGELDFKQTDVSEIFNHHLKL